MKNSVLGGFGSPLIETDRPTVASYLKSNGYATKAVGKWHIGLEWYDTEGRSLAETDQNGWNIDGGSVDYARGFGGGPTSLGFDEFFGISGSLDMPPYCFLINEKPEIIPDRDKDYYYPQQRPGKMSEGWDDRQVDMRFTKEAVSWIENQKETSDTEPFFLYLTPTSPHRPCVPPEFLEGKSTAGNRGDMVLMVDYMVGEVMAALERTGQKDETLIIVSSDNGARVLNFDNKDYGHKPNGDLRGQKADIHEGGHREPCVAMWPAVIAAKSESNELLTLTDLFATVVDILGEQPREHTPEDSQSFYPLLQGKSIEQPVHEAVVHHSLDGMFSLRKGPWKVIFGLGSGGFSEPIRYSLSESASEGQLYNVVDDTRETKNLWKVHPEIVEEFQQILERIQRNE